MARVIVIGGGAAGLVAAGRAAELGAKVMLLERGPALGRKIAISGKGRCNVTNTAELKDFIAAFGQNGKFLYGAFSRFFRDDFIRLLERFNVPTKVERGGRVFPRSDEASDVVDALTRYVKENGVEIHYNSRVKHIKAEDGRVTAVEVDGKTFRGDAVIVATGGISYPKTGSTGDGYRMADKIGHRVTPTHPSLSAMVVEEPWVKHMQGLSLRNVKATLWLSADGSQKKLASEFGEMLFTHFGVSGPIILTLSRQVPDALKQGMVKLSLDLKPALNEEQLDARLQRDFVQARHFVNYLPDLLPKSMIPVFIALCRIDEHTPVNKITVKERRLIVRLLKDFRMTVTRLRAVDEAIVTAGGVDIKEIDPRTMESKLIKGLYFAGEVIDIDAITGGYNLQAAWSTGYVAGENAAKA